MNIPKYGVKKLKLEFEFYDGKRFEIRGRYVPQHDSIDMVTKDLDTKKEEVHLEDEQCEELSKLFYSLYKMFKKMQGDEETKEHIVSLNEYRKDHGEL